MREGGGGSEGGGEREGGEVEGGRGGREGGGGEGGRGSHVIHWSTLSQPKHTQQLVLSLAVLTQPIPFLILSPTTKPLQTTSHPF